MRELKVIAHTPDYKKVDITEGVKALYDLVLSSMEGSGLFTLEDAIPVVQVGKACGFEGIEDAERYVKYWRGTP